MIRGTSSRRQETSASLSRAAMDVLEERGMDGVSAEAIAERAGVSRRTFFNYFDHVDEALLAPVEEVMGLLIARFLERPASEPLLSAVLAVLEEPLPIDLLRYLSVVHREAGRPDRAGGLTRRFIGETTMAKQPYLEQALRARVGPEVDEVYVVSLAAAFVGVFSRVSALWAGETGGDLGPAAVARHHQLVRQAVAHLLDGFDESSAARS